MAFLGGFFTKEKIKERWSKIGHWVVKNIWPVVKEQLKNAAIEEAKRLADKVTEDRHSDPAPPTPTEPVREQPLING